MRGCKQCQLFYDKWNRADEQAREAIRLLWLFDDNPRVQEFFKRWGLWKTSNAVESANTADNT